MEKCQNDVIGGGSRDRLIFDFFCFFTSRVNLVLTSLRKFQSDPPNKFPGLMFEIGGKFTPSPFTNRVKAVKGISEQLLANY